MMSHMITVETAKNILKANLIVGKISLCPLLESPGLVLAADIFSPIDIPSFDNSAMDGYAIRWEQGNGSRKLQTQSMMRAGETNRAAIQAGEAIRIFTGAPTPTGADTIIPQEYITIENESIHFDWERFEKGANFRKTGAQNRQGDLIAEKGTVVSPGMVGLLASVGIAEVPVFAPPKVGLLLTGDELVEVGQPLSFGKIYNANGPILYTYLKHLGISNISIYKAIDEPERLQIILHELLEEVDVLVISGGISVGDYDFVKTGLENEGVKELFYKVSQKPGKPLWAGRTDTQWVFALPGNPASTLTCFNQYVKPCLEAWMGHTNTFLPTGSFPLQADFLKKGALTFFLKAKLENGGIEVLPGQESFNLIAYGKANGIAEIPKDLEFVPKGTMVNFYTW
jgi:molybdopterin molybdotransferase